MCEKCNGTGIIREEVTEFDRAKFRELFDNLIETAEAARKVYDKTEADIDAMSVLGNFYMKIIPHMENNLQTITELSVERLVGDPELLNKVVDKLMKSEHSDN